MHGLQKHIAEFKKYGANLVAISVEPPDNSLSVARKNELTFTVLSDPNLEVARKFGIVYQLPKVTDDALKGVGFDIGKYNRMEKSELPLSATYVVTNKGKIVYAFLDPDYKKRAEPADIKKALQGLKKPKIKK